MSTDVSGSAVTCQKCQYNQCPMQRCQRDYTNIHQTDCMQQQMTCLILSHDTLHLTSIKCLTPPITKLSSSVTETVMGHHSLQAINLPSDSSLLIPGQQCSTAWMSAHHVFATVAIPHSRDIPCSWKWRRFGPLKYFQMSAFIHFAYFWLHLRTFVSETLNLLSAVKSLNFLGAVDQRHFKNGIKTSPIRIRNFLPAQHTNCKHF